MELDHLDVRHATPTHDFSRRIKPPQHHTPCAASTQATKSLSGVVDCTSSSAALFYFGTHHVNRAACKTPGVPSMVASRVVALQMRLPESFFQFLSMPGHTCTKKQLRTQASRRKCSTMSALHVYHLESISCYAGYLLFSYCNHFVNQGPKRLKLNFPGRASWFAGLPVQDNAKGLVSFAALAVSVRKRPGRQTAAPPQRTSSFAAPDPGGAVGGAALHADLKLYLEGIAR